MEYEFIPPPRVEHTVKVTLTKQDVMDIKRALADATWEGPYGPRTEALWQDFTDINGSWPTD